MASYDQGYEDARFENVVSQNFHCPICLNVLKDPMMCQRNQHCFCRPCITRHLKNSQTCPTCMEELTVETLKLAPRIYQVHLSELNIRCDYFKRGCLEFVQLGNLETHVKNCGFGPVVCSNQGCLVEINKRDRTHHETEVCQFRKVKCHDCSKLRKDIDEMKTNMIYNTSFMTTLSEKLEEVERNQTAAKNEIQEMKMNMTIVKDQIGEISSEMKRSFLTVKDQLDQLATLPDKIHTIQAVQEKMIKEVEQINTDGMKNSRCNVVVAGGSVPRKILNSTEKFNWTEKTWAHFKPMKEGRQAASSVVHNSTMIVTGGWTGHDVTDSIETININPVGGHQNWCNFPAKLPCKLYGHRCVVYDGQLIIIGGSDGNECSNSIHGVLLVPPYTSKLLTRMPEGRFCHGVKLFDDKILICGGTTTKKVRDSVDRAIMYNISENTCKQMPPLPYAVSEMATVSWGDHVIVIGGIDKDCKVLNTVVIYNVKTEKSHMLPAMNYKRAGCVAVVVDNTIVVMGGKDERRNNLNSAESFSFESYSWQEHPSMNEARYLATAVSW